MKHIGIIREDKVPIDRRVPFTPQQCAHINNSFDGVEVHVQSSDVRCFTDKEYIDHGIKVSDDVSHCDILMGVKEVPINKLVEGKTYFFFSHTIKEQEYNRELLQKILSRNIQLVDYETLTDIEGRRVVAFGRYAGIVGAYNGIRAFGNRYNLFHLKKASSCFDLHELELEYEKVNLPKVKIVITGSGRVAKGAIEVMNGMGIRHVNQDDFISEYFQEAVFTQLNSRDYHVHIEGKDFSRSEFFASPERYEGDFLKFAHVADILIAAAYWDPSSPVLFTQKDALQSGFNIKLIADITCDIEGSIPSTKRPSTIDDPVYDYNPSNGDLEPPFSDEANISVMAVDNLPCELPRNASNDFGQELITHVLPSLLGEDSDGIIKRATITLDGALTEPYEYLRDFVNGVN